MPFPFLSLPAELRLQILQHLLTHRTPIHTRNAHTLFPPTPTPLPLSPSILLACKRTHTEGLPLLYAENTFQAHPTYLTSVVFALDPTRTVTSRVCLSLIRRFHVRVRLDCDTFYTRGDVARAFDGMEGLEVEVFRASWGVGGYEALEGYGDVRGVRRARVYGSLPAGMARWLEACMEGREDKEGCWDWGGFEGALAGADS